MFAMKFRAKKGSNFVLPLTFTFERRRQALQRVN